MLVRNQAAAKQTFGFGQHSNDKIRSARKRGIAKQWDFGVGSWKERETETKRLRSKTEMRWLQSR